MKKMEILTMRVMLPEEGWIGGRGRFWNGYSGGLQPVGRTKLCNMLALLGGGMLESGIVGEEWGRPMPAGRTKNVILHQVYKF